MNVSVRFGIMGSKGPEQLRQPEISESLLPRVGEYVRIQEAGGSVFREVVRVIHDYGYNRPRHMNQAGSFVESLVPIGTRENEVHEVHVILSAEVALFDIATGGQKPPPPKPYHVINLKLTYMIPGDPREHIRDAYQLVGPQIGEDEILFGGEGKMKLEKRADELNASHG